MNTNSSSVMWAWGMKLSLPGGMRIRLIPTRFRSVAPPSRKIRISEFGLNGWRPCQAVDQSAAPVRTMCFGSAIRGKASLGLVVGGFRAAGAAALLDAFLLLPIGHAVVGLEHGARR